MWDGEVRTPLLVFPGAPEPMQAATLSFCRLKFRRGLLAIAERYNTARPHMSLGGRTPDEVYHARFPAIASQIANAEWP